uniref:Uncharacterized protein n=1 Tax=Leersia perrieri TaxID=77586 RepID=A0A0D9XDA7_9ORYZ
MANSSTTSPAAAYPMLVDRYGIGGSNPESTTTTAARVFSLPASKLLDVTLPEEMTRDGNTFLETPQGLLLVTSSPSSKTFLLDPRDGSIAADLPSLDETDLPEHRRCVLSDRSPTPGCGVLVFDLV